MRHKYETRGIVLSRSSVGEASIFTTLLTSDLGLVRLLTQGARKSGAKLAHALTTLSESEVVLVRGKDGWRLSGAILVDNWFKRLGASEPRARVSRISGLLLRLVAGETDDQKLFPIFKGFLNALATFPEEVHESAEILTALRALAALGLDAGEIPGDSSEFSPSTLSSISKDRAAYIARINHGIEASGL